MSMGAKMCLKCGIIGYVQTRGECKVCIWSDLLKMMQKEEPSLFKEVVNKAGLVVKSPTPISNGSDYDFKEDNQ